jgi:hypothetical protein
VDETSVEVAAESEKLGVGRVLPSVENHHRLGRGQNDARPDLGDVMSGGRRLPAAAPLRLQLFRLSGVAQVDDVAFRAVRVLAPKDAAVGVLTCVVKTGDDRRVRLVFDVDDVQRSEVRQKEDLAVRIDVLASEQPLLRHR